MKRWALISGDIVDTVVEQDDQPDLPGYESEDITGRIIGPGFRRGADGEYSPPLPPVDPAAGLLDVPAFMERFGQFQAAIFLSGSSSLVTYVSMRAGRWVDVRDQALVELVEAAVAALANAPSDLATRALSLSMSPSEQVLTRRLLGV